VIRDMPPAHDELASSPLGHATEYPDSYDRSQLFAVSRAAQRAQLGITGALPFRGADVWTAYELTWLDSRGKPAIAIATIEVPATSPFIVESKSMKLYLGSFAQSPFGSAGAVAQKIERDVSEMVGAVVQVTMREPATFRLERFAEPDGESLDALPIDCSRYEVDPSLLTNDGGHAEEALTTHLFRSVCPVTGQPDIASVRVTYRGPRIDRAGLLRYLVSYRRHAGFHEHCVERIFVDVLARCGCERLSVHARFLRRGGIDINPFRTSADEASPPNVRTARQ
jgi:7-cyano-7-deazaguanine reductase